MEFTVAIQLQPYFISAYRERGIAKEFEGDLDGALDDFNQAIELNPYLAEAYCNRGVVLAAKGNSPDALDDYNKAIKLNPDLAEAYSDRGILWASKRHVNDALADCNKAIELKPDWAEAYCSRGRVRATQGDLDGALADFNKAIQLNSDLAEAYGNRGIAETTKGDLRGALADYTKAIELKPALDEVYINRGLVETAKGNLDGALADYSKAVELKPDSADAYSDRALLRKTKGDLTGALADCNEAIRLKPGLAEAYSIRGSVKEATKDKAGALADYNKAIELKPNLAGAYIYRGCLKRGRGDLNGAVTDFTKAISFQTDLAEAYFNRGMAWADEGEFNQARADYARAIELNPSYRSAVGKVEGAGSVLGKKVVQVFARKVAGKSLFAQNVRDGLGLALLQLPNLLLDRAGSDQAIGVDGVRLADAMGAVDGLGFDSGVPPRIIEDDVAGGGQIQTGTGGAKAEEENGAVGIVLKSLGDELAILGFSGQDVSGNLPRGAFCFQDFQHLNELAEDEDLLVFGHKRLEQFKKSVSFAGGGIVADQLRMTTNLAQSGQGSQDVNGASAQAAFGDGVQDLFAAAAQFGEVKFPLRFAQFAVAPLLDAVGQIVGHLAFEAAQHEGPQLGRKAAAGNALFVGGIFAAGLVFLAKFLLAAEVAGLNEVHDAPEVEQTVFQRRAGEGQMLIGLQLFDGVGDLGIRILDELGLVQNDDTEGKFLQCLQIAAQQGVVGHD